jgi:hypothetical protein
MPQLAQKVVISVCARLVTETEFDMVVRCHGVRGVTIIYIYLVMDNASIHKGPAVTATIAALNDVRMFVHAGSQPMRARVLGARKADQAVRSTWLRSCVLGRLADTQRSNVAASHRKCAWGNVFSVCKKEKKKKKKSRKLFFFNSGSAGTHPGCDSARICVRVTPGGSLARCLFF